MKEVLIEVSGGVAYVEQLPEGVRVIIRDYDNATDELNYSEEVYENE